MTGGYRIRLYQPSDLAQVMALFSASVHKLAADAYSAAQRQAWAPESPDVEPWAQLLDKDRVWVAETDGQLAGFIALDPSPTGDCAENTGMVDMLYCHPDHARRSVASALYQILETQARTLNLAALQTHASEIARPFFARQGFSVIAHEEVKRNGALLGRYRMGKTL